MEATIVASRFVCFFCVLTFMISSSSGVAMRVCMATVSIPASALSSGGGGATGLGGAGCGFGAGFGAGFGIGLGTGAAAGFGAAATDGATGFSTGFLAAGCGAAEGTIVMSLSGAAAGCGAAGFIFRLVASSSAEAAGFGAIGFGATGLMFGLVASSSEEATGCGFGGGAATGFAGSAVCSSSSLAAAGCGAAAGAVSGRHSSVNAVTLPIVTVWPAISVTRSAAESALESTNVTRDERLSMATPSSVSIRTTWRPDTSGAESFNSFEWERPMVRALSCESGKHFPAISPCVKRI